MTELLTALQLVVTVVLGVWAIIQVRIAHELEQSAHRLNVELDEYVRLLHRAREAVIGMHSAYIFLFECIEEQQDGSELISAKRAEFSAYDAELRGLAFAIQDEELTKVVLEDYRHFDAPVDLRPALARSHFEARSQHLHTRITQLREATTKSTKK